MSYYDIKQLSKETHYSVNTLYKKLKHLKKGEHYFKPNGGKLIFDESAIEFLVKGENHGEALLEKRQPNDLGNFLA